MNLILRKTVRTFALIGPFLLLGLLPLSANAYTCRNPIVALVTPPASINVKDTAVGQVLWRSNPLRVVLPSTRDVSCVGSTSEIIYSVSTAAVPGISPAAYKSNIEGIGYRVKRLDVCPQYFPLKCSSRGVSDQTTTHDIQIELVKTGAVASGQSLSGVFAKWTIDDATPDFLQYSWGAPVPVIIRPAVLQCTVTTPQITVPLGSIPKTAFSGIGSSAGTKPLSIDLACAGGDPGNTKAVNVTLTDNTNPANRSTTLSLTSGSMATGVAIQLLNGQAVLGYGPDSNAASNPGQWFAGNAGDGVFHISLSARYIQTAGTITPGSANGRATFTMNYN
ncbi:hypothetical protein DBV14_06415 [Variovorax sp. KBW07]|uniref:fimbrial protein n=1 Tax=Variovorax sp. KBW07 TaxID=2153358 RepID=UPI000F55F23E|nr:fimbrial protein [Variovorax sp. KBW07]RQO60197.1 hypothetical protein DBV14_06415 [Variovorax sp. KBW07]